MFPLVLDISLRIVAAAAAVGLVLVVLRVRSGAARHAAWSAVLVVMLTMPALMAIVPAVPVPHLPSLALDPGTIAAEIEGIAAATPTLDGAVAGSADRAAVPVDSGTSSSPASRPRSPVDWQPVAIALYAAGVIYLLVRLAGGWVLARRLVARATLVPCDNRVRVYESPAIATPLTTGILSPAVLLPTSWRDWPADKLDAVLAHENAHIARHDSLVALLAHVNRAIFWFHPLAWWLERTLAVTAEHACDEVAARRVEPRRYAEVLLDMADAVRLRGHRVSWQAIGVDGSGLLGARIDRVLRGDSLSRMSGPRRAALALGCAAVLVLAIACRQQIAAEPLRPDPEVARSVAANQANQERYQAAIALSVADVTALEASLEQNPHDLETRQLLISFYHSSGKVLWDQKIAGLRRHALWFIKNPPTAENVWIPVISGRYDPEGYAEGKRLWIERTSGDDVPARELSRAATFLGIHDGPLAEQLLLRGQKGDGAEAWSSRLGHLYAGAIAGSIEGNTPLTDPVRAQSPFADHARRTLAATTDPIMLATAGQRLTSVFRSAGDDILALGRTYLERAVQLDPENVRARSMMASIQANERLGEIRDRLRAAGAHDAFDEFPDTTYAAVSALPEQDRLVYLPSAAESAYMRAENIEFTSRSKPAAEAAEGRQKAAQGWARARQYAEDLLAVAERHPESPDYGDAVYRARTTLGVLALKDGDRWAAVEHMRLAAAAPVSEERRFAHHAGLRGRLVEYLLREGERDTVAEYLERSAERSVVEREQLLSDAAKIRAGVMPLAFQHAEARRVP
jgi:beta-lactamase regulating signal transducer with metallopeptidase domain